MTVETSVQYPLTIFYDQSCPLCAREISLLKQYDHANQLLTIDCSPPDFSSVEGHTREAMMRLIHARDASGRWLVGAPVFAAAYAAAGFAMVARVWGAKRMQPMFRIVYPWIADHRMLLSKMGLTSVLTWILHRLHARAATRAQIASRPCHENQCKTD